MLIVKDNISGVSEAPEFILGEICSAIFTNVLKLSYNYLRNYNIFQWSNVRIPRLSP